MIKVHQIDRRYYTKIQKEDFSLETGILSFLCGTVLQHFYGHAEVPNLVLKVEDQLHNKFINCCFATGPADDQKFSLDFILTWWGIEQAKHYLNIFPIQPVPKCNVLMNWGDPLVEPLRLHFLTAFWQRKRSLQSYKYIYSLKLNCI